MAKVVVALGGNALQDVDSDATSGAQQRAIEDTVKYLADLVGGGHRIIITHGNGPQVGRIAIQNEIARETTPAMPLDVCGAMSQGMIGYHIQQALGYELAVRGIKRQVVTVVTQVVVDENDQSFKNATKPIGLFYTEKEAEMLKKEKGYYMVEDSGRGYRRVVASPKPKRIIEIGTIKTMIDNDIIVIAAGGGGIPVIEECGKIKGVEAVIDKDLTSERLAEDIDADTLIVFTAVEKVSINFGKANQKELDKVTVEEMRQYLAEGHFAPGSMLPKVLAGIKFAESKFGRKTIITSLDKAKEALMDLGGTQIGGVV